MKTPKFILGAAMLLLSVAGFSQEDSTKKQTDTAKVEAQQQEQWVAKSYKKPNAGRHLIPVLGQYKSSTEQTAATDQTTTTAAAAQAAPTASNITITVDEQNPGKIWVEGLMPTKFYAVLKAVPGTYKIPMQTIDEKPIAEGTLMYDESNQQVSICVGCGYTDANPSDALAKAVTPVDTKSKKQKAKPVVLFNGTKTDVGTAGNQ